MAILNDTANSHGLDAAITTATEKKIPNSPYHSEKITNPEDPLIFPPGYTSEKYQEFISAAKKIVGEQNVTVITSEDQLSHEHYIDPSKAHDMHNIVEKTYFVASAVLCPRDVPDVQNIMRLCNQFDMPAWPFSIGRK
jgi:hypothetical protein